MKGTVKGSAFGGLNVGRQKAPEGWRSPGRFAPTGASTFLELPGKSYRVIEGGADSGALPHRWFGAGPISKTNWQPLAMSAWVNQGRFKGWPFRVADWM